MIVDYTLLSIQIDFNSETYHVKTRLYVCCRYYVLQQ